MDSKVVGRSHWLAIIAAFLGWMFDGFEMGLYPLVARPAVREMLEGAVQEELAPALRGKSAAEAEKLLREELEIRVGKWYSWFVAVFLFGAALGGFVFGWLGDVLGRTKAMILSVLCYSLFTGAAGLSTLPWHMAVLRFVAALGMGGEWSLGVALIMELWPSAARPVLAGVIGAAANFGFLLIAAVGYVLSGYLGDQPGAWRWLVLVGAVPALRDALGGKPTLFSVVPSLDTPVCSTQTQKFNKDLAQLAGRVNCYTVSVDLPFAQNRFCGDPSHKIDHLISLSDYQNRSFGQAYGVLIDELNLLARSVFVVSPDGKITYCQYVPEVTQEPDYDKALTALRQLAG